MSSTAKFAKEFVEKRPSKISLFQRTRSSSSMLAQKQGQFKTRASESEIQASAPIDQQTDENVFMSPRSESSTPSSFRFPEAKRHASMEHSLGSSFSTSSKPSGSSIDCGEAEQKFREKVMEHAKEKASETKDPIELEHFIKKVSLELLEGHASPVANSLERRSVSNTPKGNVSVDDIFDLAEKNAEQEASKKCLNANDRRKHLHKHGNRVLITGQAGIGKSTLSRIISQKIIDKKMLPETQYLFYIKCRDIDFSEKLNLFEFLSKYGVSDQPDLQEEVVKNIIKTINESNNVVIIFDGMDEAQTQDLSKADVPKCRPKDVVMPSVIVRSLMNSNLLPRAKVLVTSRPRQAYRFSPEYRPGAVIQILGLNEESQKKLGKQICKENFKSTYDIIHKDEDLESACYISVFCVILYAVLNDKSKNQPQNDSKMFQLNSITRVLVYLLDRYYRSEHMRNVHLSDLRKISELARKGFTQRRMIFDLCIINEVGLTPAALQAFTVTYVDADTKLRLRILDPEEKCCFSHLIWQEFFTAINLMFFAPPDVFEECQEYFISNDDYNRWEVVTKFMYGLTNDDVYQYIKKHLISTARSVWSERQKHLWTASQVVVSRQVQDSIRLVQVCNWVQEVDDYSFTEKVVSKFPETFKLHGGECPLILLLHDVRSILRLLHAAFDCQDDKSFARGIKNFDFDNVKFTRDSFRNFASNMSKPNRQIYLVRLNNCDLGNSPGNQIIRFMEKVKRFHISYCNLNEADLLSIKKHYEKLPDPQPEVWVFLDDALPCDVGEEFRRKKNPIAQLNEQNAYD